MESIPYYYFSYVLLSCFLAMVAIWARRQLWIRSAAVIMLAVLLGIEYFALTDLLSRPKPAVLERQAERVREARVLAASLDEGNAIYLWLRLPDLREPRYYAMPWEHEAAVELQKAIAQADLDRTFVMMRAPFESTVERRKLPKFYSTPQPRLPIKPVPEAYEYRHPSLSV